jgi:hypothetical protein|tara:strand:+ start:709 stop:948 length:240 start_codon:yes stop_codon:yes gene_type:complete
MKKLLIPLALTVLLTSCFDEEIINIDPETMSDCIEIKNFNDRDICKMKLKEKLDLEIAEKNKTKAERTLGSKDATSIRF